MGAVGTKTLRRAENSEDFLAAAAQALGFQGWRVEAQIDVSRTLQEAFAWNGPSLIDVTVDPRGYLDQLTALRG